MSEPSTASVRGIDLPHRIRRARNKLPTRVRRSLKQGLRGYGTLTAAQRTLPDFLIIGAKKAGTSSLMNWLLRHPFVVPMFPAAQGIKSPHYFDLNYWRGPRWYASHFASRRSRHRREQHLEGLTITGEASPYYLFHPAVAERVAADLPDVRIIVLLRDPVSRAYSNYWDRRAFGTEELPTFEDALAAEPRRLASVDTHRLRHDPRYYSFHHDHHSYLARGRYAEHVTPWTQLVPAERLLLLQSEQLFADPTATFAAVQRFLRIPETVIPLTGYNQRPRAPMAPATRAWLADYYRPHNAALYAKLERDLGWDD